LDQEIQSFFMKNIKDKTSDFSLNKISILIESANSIRLDA